MDFRRLELIRRKTFAVLALAGLLSSFVQARDPIRLANIGNLTSVVDAMVLTEVYKQAGIDLIIVPMPPARATVEATRGTVDGEVNRVASYGDARPTLIRVEPPLYSWQISAFYKKSSKVEIHTSDDLAPYTVGHVRGLKRIEDLVAGVPRVEKVNTTELLLKMLDANRIDVAVDGTNESNFYLRRLGYGDIVQVELERQPIHHYLHVKHKDLVPVIGGIIKKLSDSGELARMFVKAEQDYVASGATP